MLPLPLASSNADTVAGLRALADWLEHHPDLSLRPPTLHLALPHAEDNELVAASAVEDFANQHTRFEVHADQVQVEAVRQFGPVKVGLVGADLDALRLIRKTAGKQ